MSTQIHKAVIDTDTGWYITPQEAYLPEEWEEHAKTCGVCGDEFVLYTPGDDEIRLGRANQYCSQDCKQEAHRKQSREWAAARRAQR